MQADVVDAALAPVVRKELARRRLLEFAEYLDPNFKRAQHLSLIADALERVERREIRKLAIFLPPRHGKTELVSRKFAAWYWGRNPSHQIICASYGSELAEGNARAVRSMIEDERFPFDVKLRDDSRSVGRMETTRGGVLIASGVGTGLTGRGGHLILCDDLVKDREAAESDAIRSSTASWFSDVLRTRMMPGAALVTIGTRWHEDDILGSVMRESGWEVISLPLISEENDALGRKPGELLWPSRFTLDDIPSVERGEISSRSFAALYQQRPSPASGNIFKRAWFDLRYGVGVPRVKIETESSSYHGGTDTVEKTLDLYCAIDCASKTGVSNDFSVIVTIASDGRNFYVVDVVQERLEFPNLVRKIREVHTKWKPRLIFVEEASAGYAVVQTLKAGTNLPIVGVPVKGSKESRADAVSALFEAGRVYFPERAPWLDAYVDEMASFPSGRHDDMVDATVLGIDKLSQILARKKGSIQAKRFSGWSRCV
jgi:predicted phage terminase large subunit-like protein